jgi:hypothetical protein
MKSADNYIAHYGKDAVPLVPPVPKATNQWPPKWLADLSAKIPESPLQRPPSRGWRLASGTVICASCNPKPGKATAVILHYAADGPKWVEDPVGSCVADSPRPENTTEHIPGEVSTAGSASIVSGGSASAEAQPEAKNNPSLGEGWL